MGPMVGVGVLPDTVAFSTKRLKDGRYRFAYSESFRDAVLVKRTFAQMKHAVALMKRMGLSVTVRGRTLTLRGVAASEHIGNMMVGEFLCWSTLGAARLRDLIAGYAVAGGGQTPGMSTKELKRIVRDGTARRRETSAALSAMELRRLAAVPAFPPGFEAEFDTVPVNLGVGDLIGKDMMPEKFLAQMPEAERKP